MDYQPEYKPQHHSSEGEEIIEMYLDDQGIKYQREVEITGLRGDTKSVRRADFYLPRYKVYLEFLGEWNTPKGREEYHIKKDVYKNNNIPCIYIYPENLGILDFIFRKRLQKELEKRPELKWQRLRHQLRKIKEKGFLATQIWFLLTLTLLIVDNLNKGLTLSPASSLASSLLLILCLGLFIYEVAKTFHR